MRFGKLRGGSKRPTSLPTVHTSSIFCFNTRSNDSWHDFEHLFIPSKSFKQVWLAFSIHVSHPDGEVYVQIASIYKGKKNKFFKMVIKKF